MEDNMGYKGEWIPLDQCEDGAVYKIQSRNLVVGVFSKAANGFIGIRTKFGSRFLFTEYHYDTGAPFGTVCPKEKLAIKVPDGIEIVEGIGTTDRNTGRPVEYDKTPDPNGNGTQFVDGKEVKVRGWYFTDTNEASEGIYGVFVENAKLFQFLDTIRV
jgi:hypothetical protein